MRRKFFKNENGAITLFILLAILFFLIILSSLYFNSSNKIQAQASETDKIKKEYEKDINNVDQIYLDTLNNTSTE